MRCALLSLIAVKQRSLSRLSELGCQLRCVVTACSIILICVWLNACSTVHSTAHNANAPQLAAIDTSGDGPVTLQILEEMNDGKMLHVRGRVVTGSGSTWEPDEAVLRLIGASNGEVVNETRRPLNEILSQSASNEFYISLPSQGVSDYQVELLWGKEALPYTVTKSIDSLVLRNMRVERQAQECRDNSCEIRLRVRGELHNNGQALVESAELGVAFAWQNLADSNNQSQTGKEELVKLADLKLLPGKSREISLVFDKPVRELKNFRLQPVVRVIATGS